ncbi:hypothetical protein NSB24_27165 [Blautia coccoides]|jgi:hypothetical protein|uniref:Uncharacterized protein n=1 Tax=Blautia producta TaxID=33035 RepID=A0ABZ0U578_9FIRM|nr:hypothetical protein [Blautia coccoides]MCR1989869.1 hypothetical protein [Blautia coccoides]TCO52247.1 hypothetical protein EV205_14611 [Blautia coccoides]WPX72370.1 hypothetical protein BLCOC_07060 [Blautia coccoides]SUY05809.1 Uncharacterised protein [Blautia coccoides]
MKRKKSQEMIFLRLVILLLFLLAIFIPAPQNRYWMLCLIIVGVLGTIVLFFPRLMPFKRLKKKIRLKKPKRSTITADEQMETFLLCQISHRITGKLKSAYPEATWDWEQTPSVHDFVEGTLLRIVTKGTNNFNHAELYVDQYGQLHMQMMMIETLGKQTMADTENSIDPQSWYDLIGKPLLDKVIQDVYPKGYQKLYISSQGELYITKGDQKDVKDIFEYFPPKPYWTILASILNEDELNATATDFGLEINW